MKLLILILILAITLISGCTQTTETSFCKGYTRCFNGTVTEIIDGDTLMLGNISIRLALVDAPEYGEVGYERSKEFALSICPVGSIALIDEDDGQSDSYGRIVAVVYCNGRNLNKEMLAKNYATLYRDFCNVSEFAGEEWVNC